MLHRAREALRQCLPDQLKDNTFSSCMKDDNATKRWLMQLQQNLEAPGIPDPRSMPLSWSRSRSTYVHNSVMWKVQIRTYGTCKESEGSERFECWIMRFLDVDKLLFCMCAFIVSLNRKISAEKKDGELIDSMMHCYSKVISFLFIFIEWKTWTCTFITQGWPFLWP